MENVDTGKRTAFPSGQYDSPQLSQLSYTNLSLQQSASRIPSLPSITKDAIGQYLLSSQSPDILASIPITRLVNGDYIALSKRASDGQEYIFVDDDEAAVFK